VKKKRTAHAKTPLKDRKQEGIEYLKVPKGEGLSDLLENGRGGGEWERVKALSPTQRGKKGEVNKCRNLT